MSSLSSALSSVVKDAVQTLLSPATAADRLGIATSRLWKLAKDGRIDAVKTATGFLFTPEAVDAFAVERKAMLKAKIAKIKIGKETGTKAK